MKKVLLCVTVIIATAGIGFGADAAGMWTQHCASCHGKDGSGSAILAALSRRGLSPAAVSAIFLTHGHGDHTAGCKLFPGAEVYALQSELELIGGDVKVHNLDWGFVAKERGEWVKRWDREMAM